MLDVTCRRMIDYRCSEDLAKRRNTPPVDMGRYAGRALSCTISISERTLILNFREYHVDAKDVTKPRCCEFAI